MYTRVGITVFVFAFVTGCNTNLVPNGGTTDLDDNGFTDAPASPGGTGGHRWDRWRHDPTGARMTSSCPPKRPAASSRHFRSTR